MTASPLFAFDNSYAAALEGFYESVRPQGFTHPELVALNESLASECGLDISALRQSAAQVLSGNQIPPGATPIAQAYAGHQFGGFNPQLGDGRAVLLGEILDGAGQRWDLQLKGCGRTPFSRRGDGRATLGPILREYLLGEAMHHLGIPTTRVLAVLTTGETVIRERQLPGAVLCRVAASHIRIGTFQFFSARGDFKKLEQLVDYTLARHYPEKHGAADPAFELLSQVAMAQANLVAQWMLVGFIHGVMNTDNVTVSGETIDYGPCAFMEAFNPATVFSSIDHGGRYAYGNQPSIGAWNLTRLAEALLPLIQGTQNEAKEKAQHAIRLYVDTYQNRWLVGMKAKLGLRLADPDNRNSMHGAHSVALSNPHTTIPQLPTTSDEVDGAEELAIRFLQILHQGNLDFTSSFRSLSQLVRGETNSVSPRLLALVDKNHWRCDWLEQAAAGGRELTATATSMDQVNPIYIARNQKVEEALTAAIASEVTGAGDLSLFERLLKVLSSPFDVQPNCHSFAAPATAEFGPYRTFCGT